MASSTIVDSKKVEKQIKSGIRQNKFEILCFLGSEFDGVFLDRYLSISLPY